jgi:hypothetical protein
MIQFSCDRCGQDIEVDEARAGQTLPCAHCGYAATVPSGGFRLQPIPEEEQAAQTAAIEPYELADDEPPPEVLEPGGDAESSNPVGPPEPGGIPEEFLADRAPLALEDEVPLDDDTGPIELAPDEDLRERS